MNRFLFKRNGVKVDCLPPQREDPDGWNVMNLEDAAKFVGIDEETLRQRWLREYGDYLVPAPAPVPTVEKMVQERADSLLKFVVADHAYRTFITSEHLIDLDGRPAAGRVVYSDKLILISSQYAPNTWEETWFHEVAHALENHFPKPEDAEKGREWETNLSINAHSQYNSQGGKDTLLSMKPITGMAPMHVRRPDASASRDQLIRRKFSYLSDYQFTVAKVLWEELGLNPWLGHFNVRNDQGEITVVPTLAGLMSIIMHKPGFKGNCKRQFEMNERSGLPISCVSTIKRKIGDEIQEFTGEAFWDDCFGPDPREISRITLTYARDSLGARADIRAMKMAYADCVGNLRVEEEAKAPVQRLRDAARTWPDSRR